ncbi:MAG: hypothetical protein IPN95_11095 [Bacteroidetes bacterium]|nr:hypothetical protein [Bacteroidota bacterium]
MVTTPDSMLESGTSSPSGSTRPMPMTSLGAAAGVVTDFVALGSDVASGSFCHRSWIALSRRKSGL